jgi:hypothetical protein
MQSLSSRIALLLIVHANLCMGQQFGRNYCQLAQDLGGGLAARTEVAEPEVLRMLEDSAGVPQNLFRLWPSTDPALKDNAGAQVCNGEPFVFYDPRYFGTIAAEARNWAKYFLFAHEVGHHQSQHFTGVQKSNYVKHLEADRWAGWALSQLGITSPQLMLAVDTISPNDNTIGEHAGRCERRKFALQGYSWSARSRRQREWVLCGACLAVPNEPGVYMMRSAIRGTAVSPQIAIGCVSGAPPSDRPMSFEKDLSGLCLERSLAEGELLTWNNVGLCSSASLR